jgi:hypothetical protein
MPPSPDSYGYLKGFRCLALRTAPPPTHPSMSLSVNTTPHVSIYVPPVFYLIATNSSNHWHWLRSFPPSSNQPKRHRCSSPLRATVRRRKVSNKEVADLLAMVSIRLRRRGLPVNCVGKGNCAATVLDQNAVPVPQIPRTAHIAREGRRVAQGEVMSRCWSEGYVSRP